MLQPVSQVGSFTKQSRDIINANFAALVLPDLWVRPQTVGAINTNPGTYEKPFATMQGALTSSLLRPGMTVGLQGVITEEVSTARVNDIHVIGMANLPRQATTSAVPNGGGATWLSPSGGTGALLQPNGQGWTIENIFFNNSATAAPCIKLVNAGDPPTSNCSEKTTIRNCILTGTDDGISALDLPNNILIQACRLFGFSGSGDLAISSATGAGTGTLNGWVIEDCDFLGNAGHITAPFTSATIRNCHFSYIYGSVTSTTQVVLTSGSNNSVYNNQFDVPMSQNGLTAMFGGGTNDRWADNSMGSAVLTPLTGRLWGVPAS